MLTTSEIFHDTRIINEATTLSKKYLVTVLARRYPGQKTLPFSFRVKLINYRRMPLFQWNIISSFFSLIKAAFKENPDIFHAHDLDGLLCAYPAALIRRKTLIYDSHELWSDTYPFSNLKGIQWLFPILERLLIPKVKAGITVNQSIARILQKKYHKRFIAICSFPLIGKILPSRLKLKKLFPGKKIILHSGSADEGRGHEQIIQAAKFLPQDMVIVFLGRGYLFRHFQDQVKELGINNVFFLPFVPSPEVLSVTREADLGLVLHQKISLSYFHALPNKLFQYIAAQVPVLGSNFPEMKKIILGDKIGEVVDPSKPKLIAQKIIRMLKSENQKKYRQNLVGLDQKKYNWDIEAKKLIKFYSQLS
jgi:glycosyltransferase involved in cell wall biosynthesis